MRYTIILAILFTTALSFADTKLFRYTDKISGEERGISYSDNNGNPQNNPNWNVAEISERDKENYINLQREQQKAKPKEKTIEERVKALENIMETLTTVSGI